MNSAAWLSHLRTCPAIAVIRSPTGNIGARLAQCAIAGGLHHIEITWNSDRPAHLIAQLRTQFPHCTIGAGTLLTPAQMQDAIAAGAQFLFSPHTNPDLIHQAQQHAIPMIPGAMTPTEMLTAWQAGATAVKVFPIHPLGGVGYLQAIAAALDTIPLIPTGGVTLETAVDYLHAGAIAVGLSRPLFPQEWVKTAQWQRIQQHIHHFATRLTTPM